jgi:hypothetical protein
MLGALQDFATQHGVQFAKNGFPLFAEVAS